MPLTHAAELARLKSLNSYAILDTAPEPAFDDLTLIAAGICMTPISVLSLVDDKRQWFKSKIGLTVDETPRSIAFCSHAIEQPDQLMVVEDATKDARFTANPLVLNDPNIRFYAGVPLVADDGHALGTICVIDTEPRCLTDDQRKSLQALGRQTVAQLQIRKTNQELNRRNDELTQFAYRVSHDFKAPLSTSKRLADYLVSDLQTNNLQEAKDNAIRINQQMVKLENFVEDMLNLARSDLVNDAAEEIDAALLVENILADNPEWGSTTDVRVILNLEPGLVFQAPRIRLTQIISNLLSNAFKYFAPTREQSFVKITIAQSSTSTQLSVEDNGLGIPSEFQHEIGNMFKRFHPSRASGSGLGLSIVYKHVEALGADLEFQSDAEGTRFMISFPLLESARY